MKEILDSCLKNHYKYEISNVRVNEACGSVDIEIRLNFVIPNKKLKEIEEKLIEDIQGLKHITFQLKYEYMIPDEKEIVAEYGEYLIELAQKKCGVFAKAICKDKIYIEDENIVLHVLGSKAEKILNENLALTFSKIMEENFNIVRKVVFNNHQDASAQVREKADMDTSLSPIQSRPINRDKIVASASNGGNKYKKGDKNKLTPIVGNRILGKAIKGNSAPMDTIIEPGTKAVAEGEVFQIDARTIKSGKKIVTILFSDGTTSMCSKFFASEEQLNPILEIVKEGVCIKVGGDLEWDNFSNGLVLMAKSIEKVEKKQRLDEAKNKRIELHAHTKMSAMDGLATATDLVKQAIAWGHEAIAITDHGVVQSFPEAANVAGDKIKIIYGMEGYVFDDKDCVDEEGKIDYKKKKTNHIILLAKNREGLKNLYKLVSMSHIDYFYKKPRIPKSVLKEYKNGLIIGSACEAGEVFRAVLQDVPQEEMAEIISLYDYLEIQPIVNNQFLISKGVVKDEEGLRNLNRRIVHLGEIYNKPVVATCDAHYISSKDGIFRNILMSGQGYTDGGGSGLYLRTTDEMLKEFDYLSEPLAMEIVVDNPKKIADQIENMKPVPKGKFPPRIPDSDNILRKTCEDNAFAMYGNPLPLEISQRFEKELNSIIGNKYSVMYVSAKKLVDKSMEDGFLVGSRGSVGSSFVATMSGITEVNPLPPHYICSNCKYLEWGDKNIYDCGVDMEEKKCPKCGATMGQDGFSIPFETFLGFDGDKEPDIDLNFAGEYQATAHKYVDEIFGEKNVYKAGTIGTIAAKTAYGFVKKYFDEKGIPVNNYEVERLSAGCTGVKRTTGQHPGGIIIVPDDHDIHEFCPVQRPANDMKSEIITTHFDYHSIDSNLLKLDILGHDVPSMIRQLKDMTAVDPQKVPLKDKQVNSIFNGIEGLSIKDKDYKFTHGSYGIPEFGTRFVRQMLDDTKPDKFADLVRISGFSHGTNVWINNAQEFIKTGQATMREAISTRDDIMNYLILKGLPNKDAFNIMERVRKGKGLSREQENLMLENQIPDWYIESCKRISYMFPRAHAVAYVMMAYRIAYYKVYYPAPFYAVYLSTKMFDFNWDVIKKGAKAVLDRIRAIEVMGRKASDKEQSELVVLEVVYEMYARGYEFNPPCLKKSEALRFTVVDGKVQIPLCALQGVGITVGKAIEEARRQRDFETVEDLQKRTKANKTAIESLRNSGVLQGMPESDQLSLF